MGPHLQLFLILNMLPLERTVLKEIVLIALFQNESWNKYLMLRVAGHYLTPTDTISCRQMALHILIIDPFNGHISQMKFQINQHYFITFGK